MKWSWRVGRIAGIDLYIHSTFAILLAWVGMANYLQRHQVADAVRGVAFMITLFGIVVLHELGHALTARRFGIRTRDITLLPIGGLARLERMPEKPLQELLVALAGPAVNLALAAILFVAIAVVGSSSSIAKFDLSIGSTLVNLFWVNIGLAVFNLLPAFPMDGGRVLRAILAMRLDYLNATQLAANVGQMMALLFGLAGLFGNNPFLLFIALFVWVGAAQEASMVAVKTGLAGIPVQNAMISQFQALSPNDPVARAVDAILAGFQQDFPVVNEHGEVVGVLTRHDVTQTLIRHGQDVPIAEVMQTQFKTVEPTEMLETALAKLEECHCQSIPVVRNGRLVGILNKENVGEFLAFRPHLKTLANRRERRSVASGVDGQSNS